MQLFSNSGPLVGSVIHVVVILLVACTAWWVSNRVIGKIEKKYHDHPFFEKNDSLFVLLKRGTHYSVLILTGIGLGNLFQAPIIEKCFYAFMVLLLTSIANSIVKTLLPHPDERIAAKTNTEVDDVILDLMGKFSGVILYTVGGILALDLLGLNVVPSVAGASVAGIAIGFAAKDRINKVALELDWVMHDPAPKVVVRKFGESAVDLQARVWIREQRSRMDTISSITDRLIDVFQQEGIEIPYPKRDIYIKKEPS